MLFDIPDRTISLRTTKTSYLLRLF